MGLASVLRTGVRVAKRVTATLQVPVQVSPRTGQDVYNKPTYGVAATHDAIVDYTTRLITDRNGQQKVSLADITFLEDVSIAVDDKVVLPGGVTGPILRLSKPGDPGTADGAGGYITQVWLGFQ